MCNTSNAFVGTALLMLGVVKKENYWTRKLCCCRLTLVSWVNVNNMAHCMWQWKIILIHTKVYSILTCHDNAENMLVVETDNKGLILQKSLDNFFHLLAPKCWKFIWILQNILILIFVCTHRDIFTYSGKLLSDVEESYFPLRKEARSQNCPRNILTV